jgi:hypothetical protein
MPKISSCPSFATMQIQHTNISCITGLFIIFAVAAFVHNHFRWIAGVVGILVVFGIRNWLGEVSKKTEWLLTLLSWFITIATILILT